MLNATADSNLKYAQNRHYQQVLEESDKSLIEAQIECEKTLKRIYHLVRQDKLIIKDDGTTEWKPIPKEERIFTDWGVDKIMQICSMYIVKEVLLSNFNEEQINRRMLKFCKAFNSNVFMKYEKYFNIPTIEQCKSILKKTISERVELKKFAMELIGKKDIDKEKIEKEIIEEYESKIEQELEKIKRNQLKINLKEYELIFTEIENLVEAVHYRAWKGKERESLRKHWNISELVGGREEKKGGFSLFPWRKR